MSTLKFIIGEDKTCPSLNEDLYCNGPLAPGTSYMYDFVNPNKLFIVFCKWLDKHMWDMFLFWKMHWRKTQFKWYMGFCCHAHGCLLKIIECEKLYVIVCVTFFSVIIFACTNGGCTYYQTAEPFATKQRMC